MLKVITILNIINDILLKYKTCHDINYNDPETSSIDHNPFLLKKTYYSGSKFESINYTQYNNQKNNKIFVCAPSINS